MATAMMQDSVASKPYKAHLCKMSRVGITAKAASVSAELIALLLTGRNFQNSPIRKFATT